VDGCEILHQLIDGRWVPYFNPSIYRINKCEKNSHQ
jgi:hypothetical protein